MKKYVCSITAGLCFAVLVFSVMLCNAQAKKDGFCSDVLRLHVISNSNSESDIRLKEIAAREVSDFCKERFSLCKTMDEAKMLALGLGKDIEKIAQDVLIKNGCYKNVSVIIGKQNYGEREYDGKIYPEGTYCSVRVVIGEGRGKNFWCVLFPGVCNGGVEEKNSGSGTKIKIGFIEYIKERMG